MQDLVSPVKLTPDQQIIAEINKEYTLKGRQRKIRGLILWGVNPNDWSVKKINVNKIGRAHV